MHEAGHKAGQDRDTGTGLAGGADVEVWEGKALAGEAQAAPAHGDTAGLEPQPSVENILKAEQQEPVQGPRQLQLRQHQEQPTLQEGPERAASQVLQAARSLLQGEE